MCIGTPGGKVGGAGNRDPKTITCSRFGPHVWRQAMSDTPSSVRAIDRGTPPERFARGWPCLGLQEPCAAGKPHGFEAFGGKLVVWQDSTGAINVLDGY